VVLRVLLSTDRQQSTEDGVSKVQRLHLLRLAVVPKEGPQSESIRYATRKEGEETDYRMVQRRALRAMHRMSSSYDLVSPPVRKKLTRSPMCFEIRGVSYRSRSKGKGEQEARAE
jgi:hypothetical protein